MNDKERAARNAAMGYANLTVWSAIIALLEGGLLCGTTDNNKEVSQIIKIAKRQIHIEIDKYDEYLARVKAP